MGVIRLVMLCVFVAAALSACVYADPYPAGAAYYGSYAVYGAQPGPYYGGYNPYRHHPRFGYYSYGRSCHHCGW